MDLLKDLNEPQRQAVIHKDGPLLILAGAGSGKTRVITRRVAWLVENGVKPWQILAITFTNKAAGEMAERIEVLGVGRGPVVCTFHSLCARLLRQYAVEAGMQPNYSIYDRDDQLRLTKGIVDSMQFSEYSPAQLHGTISNAKNDLKTPADFAAEAGHSRYHRAVAEVYKRYQKGLAENNAMDFDDLLMKMAFLMRDRPDIRAELSARFRYILVDEYQDTNRAQYILAHGIAMDHENICVTGDPDQSIYAWRGADIRNILEFEADYPNCVTIRLEENYRSSQPILQAASSLIAHNTQRKDKALFTRREGGQNVAVVYTDDEHAEAQLVCDKIRQYTHSGGNGDDVAIFYRVNSLSRLLEEKLLRAGIPYRIARGTEFYNRRIVKDVLAYLRTLVNPADDLSCLRIINTPTRGIGAATINKLTDTADRTNTSILEVCRQPDLAGLSGRAGKAVTRFARLIDSLAADLDRPCQQIMEDVVKKSTIQDALSEDSEENLQDRANIDELVNTAADFDANQPEGTLAD
ncbi:MAG: ATP-dependent helicase, partial [Planctomycetota bacterium]